MTTKPLKDLRVIEFTHAVMGPVCGMILADLGAEVVFVEPPEGSPTRRLGGFGSGYFPYFGRSKKSIDLDLKKKEDLLCATSLIQKADVLIENFAPGTMDRLSLGFKSLRDTCPHLIYCSLKGFLSGPFEDRTALDEVVQMMGGLAYMTGPTGQPLRAGTSVIDITGGMFGVIGILAALKEREATGLGTHVGASLFETTAFLMGQHLACSVVTGRKIPPMPERVSAWGIYHVFATKTDPIFMGVISEKQWQAFCREFECPHLLQEKKFNTNRDRVDHSQELLPLVRELMGQLTFEEAATRALKANLPFAPIAKPEDLFDHPQLNHGGFDEVAFSDGKKGKQPRLPLEISGERIEVKAASPRVGQHKDEILAQWLK